MLWYEQTDRYTFRQQFRIFSQHYGDIGSTYFTTARPSTSRRGTGIVVSVGSYKLFTGWPTIFGVRHADHYFD